MGLTKFVKPYWVQFTAGSVAKLSEAILELYLPILMARILDNAIPTKNTTMAYKIGIEMLLFVLLGFGCAAICQYFAAVVSQGVGTRLRNAMMKRVSGFSYQNLDFFGTSTLMNRLTNDVNNYQNAVAISIRTASRAPFICFGAVILSFQINQDLAYIFIILIPILSIVLFLFMRVTAPMYQKAQEKLDEFALLVRENLSGIRIIRAFAKTKTEETKATDAAILVKQANIRVGSISAWVNPISSLLLNLGVLFVLYFGASKINTGSMARGELLALTVYATKILYAIGLIANIITVFTKAFASGRRIQEVLETQSDMIEGDITTVQEQSSFPMIVFDDVSFQYQAGGTVLHNLSFAIEQGKTVGIVGVTGSGKTTMIHILQHFYNIQSGHISIMGVPIQDYTNAALRQMIGIVPQQNTLFSGTIADNIRIRCEHATDTEIEEILKTAQCWDFVSSLPDGMYSPIFEGGKNFSGGQKQRLTIARALIGNPKILILDDSLSALDYKTDLALRQSLKDNNTNLTTLIISQRISSVMNTDKIIVLDKGHIVGTGTHDELLIYCSEYKEIYDSQMDEQEGVNHE